jgi:hypothetical protein
MLSIRSKIRSVGLSSLGFFEGAMSEEDSKPHGWSDPQLVAARDEFNKAFGKAMTAWAGVEDGLFEWFKTCSGMYERLARAVFYSARSFGGRRDMLIATIPLSELDEKTKEGIRQCIKRARSYAEFRNRITHGHVIYNAALSGRASREFVFTEGHALAGPFDIETDVTIEDLKIAAENFEALADLTLGFHPEWQTPDVCEAGCLAEILGLPRAANSRERPLTGE